MRLGVYADLKYRRDGGTLTADRAFVDFVAALPPRVEELVLFGRLDPRPGRHRHVVPSEGVRFVALPHYPSARNLPKLAGALRGSVRAFAAELPRLDAVWLFGPHPLALAFARGARRGGVPIFLGVRQDFPRYVGHRARWALPAAWALELAWRRLRAPAVVVGEELARSYRRSPVLATGFSLVRGEDVADPADALTKNWSGELRLLSVGRLDPEKNPLLLAEALARLDPRWRLEVVGEGPLAEAVVERARRLGVAERLTLTGYVPSGPALWERYRRSHAFLHVSLTEGFPQVLFEALAAGLPVVATDVGGVRAAVADFALLVPPRDAASAAAALERLQEDPGLRRSLVERGLASAALETRDAQLDRVAEFFAQQLG